MKLSERKKFILCSVIEDYIKDASPITSGAVREKHIQDISTATLRNELNALESMGYLKQLHTSGGRVPTAEGYKYYVSSLLEDFSVSEKELKKVQNALDNQTSSLNQILSGIAEMVSKATNYPTVLVTNGYDKLVIEEIKIIPILDSEALVLFRTKSGIIKNSLNVKDATEKICDDASRYLTRKFAGRTIGEMFEGDILEQSLGEVQTFKSLVDCLIESMKTFVLKNNVDVRSQGAQHLLDENQQKSVKQTKKILSLLSDEEELANAVINEEDDISVKIAGENDEMEGCALISAPIIIKGTPVASIAVIGPDRMDYATIAQALKIVMSELKNK
ncbi:MAG: heat-inducible transcription repressor HrcA [Clostridia bacterium]|nr:heat-inducible transcription repressor HrcA [Clostridia bacterium]